MLPLILQSLEESGFPAGTIREILLAAAGKKVSRTYLTDEHFLVVKDLSLNADFTVMESGRWMKHQPDIGKGGWSNSGTIVDDSQSQSVSGIEREVYIGTNLERIISASEAEQAGDDEKFGEELQIPDCCRDAYLERLSVASSKQFDFTPLVAKAGAWPDAGRLSNNFVSQYFGWSLLSYFPCSFQCVDSSKSAQATFSFLEGISKSWANRFSIEMGHPILYTEYSGLFQFRDPQVDINSGMVTLTYNPDQVVCTASQSPLAKYIYEADTIEARAVDQVVILSQGEQVARLSGEDIALCHFH